MISIVVCDDNQVFLDRLALFSEILLKRQSIDYKIIKFNNGTDLIKYCITDNNIVDIVFLDIELGDSNGLEISNLLTNKFPTTQIIYVTAHIDYARSICMTKYQNFIVKPINADNLDFVLKTAIENINSNKSSYITVTSNGKTVTINTNEIIFCESQKRIIVFHTLQETLSTYMKISDIEKDLPENFLRIHKSFVVNLDYIKELNYSNVVLSDETVIPVPNKKHSTIKTAYLKYMKEDI